MKIVVAFIIGLLLGVTIAYHDVAQYYQKEAVKRGFAKQVMYNGRTRFEWNGSNN
mgnify:CR=1 FL=1